MFEESDIARMKLSAPLALRKRPLQWGLNTIWAVDDFTDENGATRFALCQGELRVDGRIREMCGEWLFLTPKYYRTKDLNFNLYIW